MATPEDLARQKIDEALEKAGWRVQDLAQVNLRAARGVAVRNFPLQQGHGFADYLLYLDGKAAGVVEAKKEGFTLIGVEVQAARELRHDAEQAAHDRGHESVRGAHERAHEAALATADHARELERVSHEAALAPVDTPTDTGVE